MRAVRRLDERRERGQAFEVGEPEAEHGSIDLADQTPRHSSPELALVDPELRRQLIVDLVAQHELRDRRMLSDLEETPNAPATDLTATGRLPAAPRAQRRPLWAIVGIVCGVAIGIAWPHVHDLGLDSGALNPVSGGSPIPEQPRANSQTSSIINPKQQWCTLRSSVQPVRLGWAPSRGVVLYLVEISRGGVELCSAYTTNTTITLSRSPNLGPRSLGPGPYEWSVWPVRVFRLGEAPTARSSVVISQP